MKLKWLGNRGALLVAGLSFRKGEEKEVDVTGDVARYLLDEYQSSFEKLGGESEKKMRTKRGTVTIKEKESRTETVSDTGGDAVDV
jgi:hypothetical protein